MTQRQLNPVSCFLVSVALCIAVSPAAGQDNSHTTPRLRVLGTAQDGGLPHAACACDRCNAARDDDTRKRSVASLALIVPEEETSPSVYLVDATPDIRDQLDALRDVRDDPSGRVDRAPIDGVMLTHAHIGHYLGLAFFGFEAVSTKDLPVHCTPRMAEFLETNGPWEQMVETGNIQLHKHASGEAYSLGDVKITPVKVPHRDEYSDTVGYRFEGPTQTVLYIPDTEPWRKWKSPQPDPMSLFEGVDVLLVDGSFYSPAELPGRDVALIGHPLMTETMDLLEDRVRNGDLVVYFTHLNHSNPALDPDSEAAKEIRRRGFWVADDGQEFKL